MSDREILEKYINLDSTCLTEEEKREVMDILYRYKEAFSFEGQDRHLSEYKSRNSCDRQISIFLSDHIMLGKKIRR